MPNLPEAQIINNQLKNTVEGKRIIEIKYEQFHQGNYSLDTISFDNIQIAINAVIIQANANYLQLNNGHSILIGYDSGGLRYYQNSFETKNAYASRKHITSGYFVEIYLDDQSCLTLSINSWTCSFKIVTDELFNKRPFKLNPAEPEEFTYMRFRSYFNVGMGVLAVCTTTKGCLDISRNAVHEALFRAHIHPKTKACHLDEKEISMLYHAIIEVVCECISKGGVQTFYDLFGKSGKYVYSISSKSAGKPCPVCGEKIIKDSAFASTVYLCPNCQILK